MVKGHLTGCSLHWYSLVALQFTGGGLHRIRLSPAQIFIVVGDYTHAGSFAIVDCTLVGSATAYFDLVKLHRITLKIKQQMFWERQLQPPLDLVTVSHD